MNDTLAHPEARRCFMCNKELKDTHDHGVKVVPSPKGPRPVSAIPRPFGLGKYAASIQAHINEEVRLADNNERLQQTIKFLDNRILELEQTIKELRAIIWPGAILEHHYGGSHNKPHTNLLPGDLVEGCTEGYCPEWWKIYRLTAQHHPYTCGLCNWGRDGFYHDNAEYENHMAHVHPDEWSKG
jgi:hypothetical protein